MSSIERVAVLMTVVLTACGALNFIAPWIPTYFYVGVIMAATPLAWREAYKNKYVQKPACEHKEGSHS